jgi:hypothetical protein
VTPHGPSACFAFADIPCPVRRPVSSASGDPDETVEHLSWYFGTVVTEALNAVITGSVHDVIRGSLMVSLGLFGLSLLARPFRRRR